MRLPRAWQTPKTAFSATFCLASPVPRELLGLAQTGPETETAPSFRTSRKGFGRAGRRPHCDSATGPQVNTLSRWSGRPAIPDHLWLHISTSAVIIPQGCGAIITVLAKWPRKQASAGQAVAGRSRSLVSVSRQSVPLVLAGGQRQPIPKSPTAANQQNHRGWLSCRRARSSLSSSGR